MMQAQQPLTREQIADQVSADSLLSEFSIPFPKLLEEDSTCTEESFARMSELLSNSRRTAVAQFTLVGDSVRRSWCLILLPGGCQMSQESYSRPDLEILTDETVWLEIVKGQSSPMEAFAQGKLRVRGSIELARSISRTLQRNSS